MRKLFFLLAFTVQANALQEASKWELADLSAKQGLSAFLNNANAILTLRKTENDEDAHQIKPTVLVYKIEIDAKTQLNDIQQWSAFLAKQLTANKRIEVSSYTTSANRYSADFMSHLEGADTDMHSAYLALRTGNEILLFVYDGVGSANSQNLQQVHELYNSLNASTYAQLTKVSK